MHTVRYFLFLVTFMAFLGVTHAQEPATETVAVEGIGKTEASAKKAAFREAIQKVVGVLIDANTQVKNEEIIKDEVLEYSGGFISKSEILSSKKDDEGLVRLKVKCVVEKTQVKKRLEDLKVLTVDLNGSGIAEKEMTKEEMRKDAAKFVNKALEERKKCYKLIVPSNVNDLEKTKDDKLVIPVEVSLDAEMVKKWNSNWIPALKKLASDECSEILRYKKNHLNTLDANSKFEPFNSAVSSKKELIMKVAETVTKDGSVKWLGLKIPVNISDLKDLKTPDKFGYESFRSFAYNLNDVCSSASLTLELLDKEMNTVSISKTSDFINLESHPGQQHKYPVMASYWDKDQAILCVPPYAGREFRVAGRGDYYIVKFGINLIIDLPDGELEKVKQLKASLAWQTPSKK